MRHDIRSCYPGWEEGGKMNLYARKFIISRARMFQ